MSRQNLTQRLGRDNFQEQDMRMIAKILDCPFYLDILEEHEEHEEKLSKAQKITEPEKKKTPAKAEERDIPRIMELLGQVLQIHADIRPDIFIPGTTKYTVDELTELLKNEKNPINVAANEADICVGYAFCQLREQPFSNNMVPFKSIFIDENTSVIYRLNSHHFCKINFCSSIKTINSSFNIFYSIFVFFLYFK